MSTTEPRTYWHGGPKIVGEFVLPPSVTGSARACVGEPWVYLARTRGLALMYAATCNGWLYEVEPVGEVEQDPDSVLPVGESVRCNAALIHRRFRPSRSEVAMARGCVLDADFIGAKLTRSVSGVE